MKFGYTILYVANVQASLAFYERAFGLSGRAMGEGNLYGELDTGTTRLAFAAYTFAKSFTDATVTAPAAAGPVAPFEIAFTTADVAAGYAKAVAAGATPMKPPETKPWGQTVAYVRDPDGVLVEICTPMD